MRTAFILAGAALAIASPLSAQELVTNGGFETGNFSGFTLAGNTTFMGVDAASAASGSFGAFFGQISTPGGINQTLATTAGQSYLISFDLNNGAPGSTNFYSVLFGSSQLFTATGSNAFNFTHFSTTATATGISTLLAFSFRNPADYFQLDNVSVIAVRSAVPEPATWAMMLIGFGAIGVSLRRRQRTLAAALQHA